MGCKNEVTGDILSLQEDSEGVLHVARQSQPVQCYKREHLFNKETSNM
jgi:hypothetical protein